MTPERTNRIIRFALPFIDMSPELIVIATKDQPTFSDILWAWTKPFTAQVWWAILICFLLTGTIYTYLEHDDIMGYTRRRSHVCGALWQTFGSFTGATVFEPATGPGKLFVSSWMWVVLLVVATYTANLASLLVVEGRKHVRISSIQDAVSKGLPLCVKTGEYHFNLLRTRFPMLMIQPTVSNIEAVNSMRAGQCAGVIIPHLLWEVDVRDLTFNPDCKLEAVSRPFIQLQGSFSARADVGRNCTDLVVDVLTLGLLDLTIDGTLDREKASMLEYAKSENGITCASNKADLGDDRLPLSSMLGIFIIHGAVCLLTITLKMIRSLCPARKHGERTPSTSNSDYSSDASVVHALA